MRRYLVVANQTLGGQHLTRRVRECLDQGPCSFHVVVPATPSEEHLTWTEGEALAIAQGRLDQALARFKQMGAEAGGEVGDPSPLQAIDDAFRRESFDEVILSTLPPGMSKWLGLDLPRRVERAVGVPVTHLIAEIEEQASERGP